MPIEVFLIVFSKLIAGFQVLWHTPNKYFQLYH